MLHLNRRLARERRHIVQDTCNVLTMFSLQSSPRHSGSSSFLILLAKPATRTIQGQHPLVNSVCQSASPREDDFASSIIFGEIEGWLMS